MKTANSKLAKDKAESESKLAKIITDFPAKELLTEVEEVPAKISNATGDLTEDGTRAAPAMAYAMALLLPEQEENLAKELLTEVEEVPAKISNATGDLTEVEEVPAIANDGSLSQLAATGDLTEVEEVPAIANDGSLSQLAAAGDLTEVEEVPAIANDGSLSQLAATGDLTEVEEVPAIANDGSLSQLAAAGDLPKVEAASAIVNDGSPRSTLMIRAAYSGINRDVLRPGVLKGIDDYSISTQEANVTYNNNLISLDISDDEGPSTFKLEDMKLVKQRDYWKEYQGDPNDLKPEHTALLYTDKAQGDNYLTFGVWMTVPELAKEKHPIGAFATGGIPFDMDDISKLKGIAKYDGRAVGIYGKRAADSETSNVGSFSAVASLTADFNEKRFDGDVTDFILNDKTFETWKVKLDFVAGGGGGDGTDNNLKFGGTTEILNGDMIKKSEGTWNVQFYGNGKLPSDHPGFVAGAFNVKTGTLLKSSNVDKGYLGIVGAFGAKERVLPWAQH